jgi:pimeloyl-ACP methyl ester carboxylesterase
LPASTSTTAKRLYTCTIICLRFLNSDFTIRIVKIIQRILLGFIILLLLATAGFVIWGLTPSSPMPEALAALQSDTTVTVNNGAWLEFSPAAPSAQTAQTAFIFYPGGHVDYRAYAPMARAIASQGYRVIIPPMPLSLAVLSPNSAAAVIAAHPEISHWAVGGHSLGGSMAANFAKSHLNRVQGLILIASYPASSDDLSLSNLHVLSVFASLDGLATRPKIDASRPLLPASTTWVSIEGGDHAQFGYYGPQSGDRPASIDRAAQQARLVSACIQFLSALQ